MDKSFNLSGPESSIHKMQIIIILITTGSFGSLDELIPVSANSTWHNSRCSVSVSHTGHSQGGGQQGVKTTGVFKDKNSHQAAQQPLFSTARKSRPRGIASSVASSI